MWFLGTLLLISVVSCHKDEHEEVVEAAISFVEPTQGDTLAFNEEIHAEGTITGTGELHGYTLTMKNLTTNEELLSASSTNHSESYAFHEHWINTVTDTSTIRIEVKVVLDHEGNTTTKMRDVIALPL